MKFAFLLTLTVAFLGCKEIKAATLKTMDPIGAHYPIITFEKNENPENIMIIYTKLNKDCQFELNPENKSQPVFDFYWMMNRKSYKPVHSLIKSGIHDRMQLAAGDAFQKDRREFSIKVNDLKELKTDIAEARMKVVAVKKDAGCEVQATMQLGPSDKNATLKIDTIYSEAEKTFTPPFRRLKSISLIGKSADGKDMKRTYTSK